MKKTFIITDEQREYLNLQRHECRAKRQKVRIYDMKELYAELEQQYSAIKKHLPLGMKTVLDIGCGLGYVDIVINDNYPELDFYMFDSMKDDNVKVYNFYNDLKQTELFLTLNGLSKDRIHLVDASSCGTDTTENKNPKIFNGLPSIDLVVSCYYWGWHSRLSKYIKEVSEVLNVNGIMAVDLKSVLNSNYHKSEIELAEKYGLEHLESIQIQEGRVLLICQKK